MPNYVIAIPDPAMPGGIRIAVGPFDTITNAKDYVARSGTDKTCTVVRLGAPVDPPDEDVDLSDDLDGSRETTV